MPIDANLGPDGWEVEPIVDRSKLTDAQKSISDITGVVAVTESGDASLPSGKVSRGAFTKSKLSRGNCGFGQSYQTGATPTFDGRSWHFAKTAEAPYVGVRIRIRGNESTSFTLNNLIVAASDNITSYLPTGAWNTVTFGGSASVVVPARLGVGRPSEVVSDVIALSSIPMANGSPYPACHVRGYVATAPLTLTSGNDDFSSGLQTSGFARMKGRYLLPGNKVGDFVSTNQSDFTSVTLSDLALSIEIEFIHLVKAACVMGLGDSITHGAGVTAIKFLGAGYPAVCNVSTVDEPVYYSNHGVPSTTTAQFLVRFQDLLANGHRPDVLIYSPFSPNDGTPSAAIIAQQKSVMFTILDLCAQYNIVPVLTTPCPDEFGGWNAAQDNFRKGFRDFINSMSALGYVVCDYDAVLSDQASPAKYITGLTTDLRHPNASGYAAMETPLTASLRVALEYAKNFVK